jgi:hypothetical protein
VPAFAVASFTEWAAGLEKHSTDLGPVDVKTETANRAYLVYPAVYTYAVYTYKEKGVATRETARMAFVLKKEGTSWKIVSWTGTNPQQSK